MYRVHQATGVARRRKLAQLVRGGAARGALLALGCAGALLACKAPRTPARALDPLELPIIRPLADPSLPMPAGEPPMTALLSARDSHRLFARGAQVGAGQPGTPWLVRPAPPPGAMARVAVIDTVGPLDVDRDPPPARGAHGYAIAQTIADLHCRNLDAGGPPCAEVVRSYPALFDTDPHGPVEQFAGTFAQLAAAIDQAVAEASADGVNLVVNLSLGWESAPAYAAAEEAIRARIRAAVCTGKIVFVAAAGNKQGAGGGSGPLLPAAWEREPVGRVPGCAADARQPLVIAASGTLTTADVDLPTSRADAQARVSAAAAHVVADAPGAPRGLTTPQSGTSMAAATTSGILAAAWSFAPDAGAHALVEAIHAGATALAGPTRVHRYEVRDGFVLHRTAYAQTPAQPVVPPPLAERTVSFCPGGTCGGQPTRRWSLCAALQAVEGLTGRPRELAPDCQAMPAFAGLPEGAALHAPATPSGVGGAQPPIVRAACDGEVGTAGCPAGGGEAHPGAAPVTSQYPIKPRCQFCYVSLYPGSNNDFFVGWLQFNNNIDLWLLLRAWQYGGYVDRWFYWGQSGASTFNYTTDLPQNTVAAEAQWWYLLGGVWNVVYENVGIY